MEQTQARSNIYALLSRILLLELDNEMLEMILNDKNINDFFPSLKGWKALEDFDNKTLLEQHINVDFANISLLHLVPYETFYTREDQMIETGGANPVTNMYHEFDYVVDFAKARAISADHIGVELEFMHYLVEAEISAAAANDEESVKHFQFAQKTFLNKHLLKWAPMYLINVKYESRTPIYYDAAEMCLEFILSDNEYLSVEKAA
ncbi:molecular chaperone TorD family protein [Sulfurimonas sp. MAG313]|nr:molecular chaperone TorD family protein [Sulfurimonas sp. MAG313]MDF1880335.1 molecular chaperone TorD family protein [Sulfurimonas sp. MAG313]